MPYDLKVLFSPVAGVNPARQLGIEQAKGHLLFFLDDDCLLINPEHLKTLLSLNIKNPEQMTFGGPYTLPKSTSRLEQAYHFISQSWLQTQRLDSTKSAALLGGNACYKKEVFLKGFTFPKNIKYGGSETPLNTQLYKHYGAHTWCEDLSVEHHCPLNGYLFLKKAYLQGRGAGAFPQSTARHRQALIDHHSLALNADFSRHIYWYSVFFYIGKTSVQYSWLKTLHKTFLLFVLSKSLYWQKFSLWINSIYWNRLSYLHSSFCATQGFLQTLFTLPESSRNLPFSQRLHLYTLSFAKKWVWLFLKIVGLR